MTSAHPSKMYRHGARGASWMRRIGVQFGGRGHALSVGPRLPITNQALRATTQTRRSVSSASEHDSMIERYKQSLTFPKATDDVSEVELVDPGSKVVLYGYLGPQSVLSKRLCFAPLFNPALSHSVQIVSATNEAGEAQLRAHAELKALPAHSAVVVTGIVKRREAAPTSEKAGEMTKVGTVEIELLAIQAVNRFPADIVMTPEVVFPPEQRHLQLRNSLSARQNLRRRAETTSLMRYYLEMEGGFFEVETPILFAPTSEGAREFLVPTRRPGLVYALPQSPQQYKQILMASGIPRYFQVARCFRDEDQRADRQPEFTQLDIEMAFATGEDVMELLERLLVHVWECILETDLPAPFPRLTYTEAMTLYGSDKPDTRLGMEISRLDYLLPADLVSKISNLTMPVVDGLLLPLGKAELEVAASRQFIADFLESPEGEEFRANGDGAPGILIYDTSKPLCGFQSLGFEGAEEVELIFEPEDGDILVLQARPDAAYTGGATMLGNLRLALHRAAVAAGHLAAPGGFAPLWVTDFPLFTPQRDGEPGQGGAAGLDATHHPFTAPKTAADVDRLATDPAAAVADHYDLVINGVELGGGSRRIHDAAMQRFVLEQVLQLPPAQVAQFDHLLAALRAGCPPHAGLALGIDRLVALMLGADSLRAVLAFPKSHRGDDPLVRSPRPVTDADLAVYHLQKIKGDGAT